MTGAFFSFKMRGLNLLLPKLFLKWRVVSRAFYIRWMDKEHIRSECSARKVFKHHMIMGFRDQKKASPL